MILLGHEPVTFSVHSMLQVGAFALRLNSVKSLFVIIRMLEIGNKN